MHVYFRKHTKRKTLLNKVSVNHHKILIAITDVDERKVVNFSESVALTNKL